MSSPQQNVDDEHDDMSPPTAYPQDQKFDDFANNTNDEYLLQLVRDTHKEATKIRSMRRTASLKNALVESRDLVFQQQIKLRKRRDEDINNHGRANVYGRLPPSHCPHPDMSANSGIIAVPNQTIAGDITSRGQNKSSTIPSKGAGVDRMERASSAINTDPKNYAAKNSTKPSPFQIKFFDAKTSKKWARAENHQPLYLETTRPSAPLSTATVFLKGQYAIEDMQDLIHVPYFNDHDDENVISEHFDTRRREKLIKDGPLYQKKATDDAIDETLILLLYNKKPDFANIGRRIRKQLSKKNGRHDRKQTDAEAVHHYVATKLQQYLSKVMNITIERVLQRYDILKSRQTADGTTAELGDNNHISSNDHNNNGSPIRTVYNSEEICTLCEDSDSEIKFSYHEHVMDSFRNLLCRRCLTYDCNNHGNITQPDIELQTKLAVDKERNGDWLGDDDSIADFDGNHEIQEVKVTRRKRRLTRSRSNSVVSAKGAAILQEEETLDGMQRVICEHAFQIFQGDTEKIASVIGCNIKSLQSYIKERSIKLKNPIQVKEQTSSQEPKKKKRKVVDNKSMKYYNPSWLKRVQDTELHPPFDQCNHTEPCSFETCSCVQNAFFCTKHCTWGEKSRNFFRGCSCKAGQCRTMSCTCFAAKRECDPDLCLMCGACTDPPNKKALRQRCRNDNIGMRRHSHLLVAESRVSGAGWGIYTKYALKKGDFVHEYVGEVISQEEAERRGAIYDKENRSYLFNLSSEGVVDARKKGNKTKFANHSSSPNCCSKVVCVNGDSKIGLFAKEDIEAQTELYFDYRYDVPMSHKLLVKPSLTVDWMKKSKAVKKTSA